MRQALKYKKQGLDVAVITPYRKQVNLVREEWANTGGKSSDILIDTVERLQGQDVDVIILTMSVSDIEYYKTQETFLLNKNRLNVMISRAKLKVIIVKSPIITLSEPTTTNHAEMASGCNGMFVIEGEPEEVTNARQLVLDSFKDLQFFEDGHRYLLNGKKLNSVSSIGHRYLSRPFDADKQAILYASKHGKTAEFWKDQWMCNSFRATTLGKKTHEFGESLAYLKAGHPEFLIRRSQRGYHILHISVIEHGAVHDGMMRDVIERIARDLSALYHDVITPRRLCRHIKSAKHFRHHIYIAVEGERYILTAGDVRKHDIAHVGINASSPTLASVGLDVVFQAVSHVYLILNELIATKYHAWLHLPHKEAVFILIDIPCHELFHCKIKAESSCIRFR